MIHRRQSVDVDASARRNTQIFDHAATLILTPRPSKPNQFAPSTSPTKVWWNSIHWVLRYRANRTHTLMDARTHERTTRTHPYTCSVNSLASLALVAAYLFSARAEPNRCKQVPLVRNDCCLSKTVLAQISDINAGEDPTNVSTGVRTTWVQRPFRRV